MNYLSRASGGMPPGQVILQHQFCFHAPVEPFGCDLKSRSVLRKWWQESGVQCAKKGFSLLLSMSFVLEAF